MSSGLTVSVNMPFIAKEAGLALPTSPLAGVAPQAISGYGLAGHELLPLAGLSDSSALARSASRLGTEALDAAALQGVPSAVFERRVGRVFEKFSTYEMPHLIANLFAVHAHRGCIQQCPGCHSGAMPRISTADWEDVDVAMEALRRSSDRFRVGVQKNFPRAMIETFRDSDSSHLVFRSGQGIGDFCNLIYEKTGRRAKVMTAGVRFVMIGGEVHVYRHDLEQLAMAARYARKLSVSASVQARWYERLGEQAYVRLVARTFEALLAGADGSNQIYLDIMCYSDAANPPELVFRRNRHPSTLGTKRLFHAVLEEVDARYLSGSDKSYLKARLDGDDIDGRSFYKVELSDRKVGFWVAPYLETGRASSDKKAGVSLSNTLTSDWLSIVDGDDDERIGISALGRSISITRGELRDFGRRHEFVSAVREMRGHGLLAESARLSGNWMGFFRSEIDLSPMFTGQISDEQMRLAPGVNCGPTVNLLVTDIVGGEWQVVLPYKGLII